MLMTLSSGLVLLGFAVSSAVGAVGEEPEGEWPVVVVEDDSLAVEVEDGSASKDKVVDSDFAVSMLRPAKKGCARRASGLDFGATPRRSEGSRTYELSVRHISSYVNESNKRGDAAPTRVSLDPQQGKGIQRE